MTDATCTPPGRWQPQHQRRAAEVAKVRWYATAGRVSLMAGGAVLAFARHNGKTGPDQSRWILQIGGWEWRICEDPPVYHHAKLFLTRTGAQIEADDIVAAAVDWRR